MLPTSTNTPSPALANVFGHQFATQLVASRGSGSPSSSPSRAKKARPTPADPTTNPNNRPLPDESHGPTQQKCTEPKVLFKTGAGDEDYQAAIVADEEAGAEAGSRCFRCKRGMDMCGGVGVCVLGSNTFTATKCVPARARTRAYLGTSALLARYYACLADYAPSAPCQGPQVPRVRQLHKGGHRLGHQDAGGQAPRVLPPPCTPPPPPLALALPPCTRSDPALACVRRTAR
jgi:hypothetical protein